jgi:DNA-binding PadR family transcriptional regulator
MSDPAFLVMTALAGQPLHGYAVLEEVRKISDGQVSLKAGSLYAILDRLHTDGLVEVTAEEVVNSRLRRYYRLSSAGAQRLTDETSRLQQRVQAATSRLRGRMYPSGTGPAGAPA